MAVSNRVRSALTTTVLATAATGFLAACGTDEEEQEQVAYCTDEDGRVVDDDYCDDGYRGPPASRAALDRQGLGGHAGHRRHRLGGGWPLGDRLRRRRGQLSARLLRRDHAISHVPSRHSAEIT